MDSEISFRAWFDALDDDDRVAITAAAGHELSPWMVLSLNAANIPIVSAHLADEDGGHRGFLMTTALTEFLERHRR